MGLKVEPVSTQVIPRDRHAMFFAVLGVVASSIERLAIEIRHLQRTEVLEAEEFFSEGQKGSSAMPHKRNPVLTENLTGLARLVRGMVVPAMENVALWHERDISHSSVERMIGPDATVTLDFALARLTGVVDKLLVYPENMQRNLDRLGGLVHSQRVLLALTQAGVSREDSYRLVQRNAMRVWRGEGDFLAFLKADPEVTARAAGRQARAAVRPRLPHEARRHDLRAGLRLRAHGRAGEGGQVRDPAAGPLWLVVNLDRSPDRLSAMAASLGALGIAFTRVPAVDGRALPATVPGVDPALYRRSHGRDVLPGEVGCALSHLRALSLFLRSSHRHAVVLEDDALVTRAAADAVAALVAPGAPDDWDLVKLAAHHARFGVPLRRLSGAGSPGLRLCAMPYRAAGSAAYLVDRAAAAALLAGLLPLRFPYDIAFERGWDFGLRVRAVLPPPVTTAPVAPTLAREAGMGARRRAPALARAGAKAMFAASALGAGMGLRGRRRARGEGDPARFALAERALAACGPEQAGERA